MIVVIDYGMGNLRSVAKAFEMCGSKPLITDSPKQILKADKIVLPGVGAFSAAMRELKKRKLISPLKQKLVEGTPYLGLCLGLQLLFEESEEKEGERQAPKGLGVIEGKVVQFKTTLKIPHMGWNTVEFKQKNNPIFKGIKDKTYFYFVHSFYVVPKDKRCVAATTCYGNTFCSSIQKGNIFATQFHPEKSQAIGLKIIKNFIHYKVSV